ncbi:hypothetical protein KEM55_007011, partial [Ascosphaera atra]
MFEKPVQELAGLRVDILDKTAYCNKRRIILLTDTADRLRNDVGPLTITRLFLPLADPAKPAKSSSPSYLKAPPKSGKKIAPAPFPQGKAGSKKAVK